jgi:hypothetical protein
MFSTLFTAKYVFGNAYASDDLDNCIWIDIDLFDQYRYVDDHAKLINLAIETLKEL